MVLVFCLFVKGFQRSCGLANASSTEGGYSGSLSALELPNTIIT